jgi:hypothetical protein
MCAKPKDYTLGKLGERQKIGNDFASTFTDHCYGYWSR